MGIKCVAYDDDGTMLTTISKWTHGDSPLLPEVLTIEVALEIALQQGWHNLGFFSDSKLILSQL